VQVEPAATVTFWQIALGSWFGAIGVTVVCADEFVTVVVPSRLTSTVNANPSAVSLVSTGIVPAASEKHAESKSATRGRNPVRRTQGRPVEGHMEGNRCAERESSEVVVERGTVIERQCCRKEAADIPGQEWASGQRSVRGKAEDLHRCGLGR